MGFLMRRMPKQDDAGESFEAEPTAIIPHTPPEQSLPAYYMDEDPNPQPMLTIGYESKYKNPSGKGGYCYHLGLRYKPTGGAWKVQKDITVTLNTREAAEMHDLLCRVAERALREEGQRS